MYELVDVVTRLRCTWLQLLASGVLCDRGAVEGRKYRNSGGWSGNALYSAAVQGLSSLAITCHAVFSGHE